MGRRPERCLNYRVKRPNMKFASIGTPAASRSRRDVSKGQAGFTLLEALVALALVLAFAAVLGPHLSQARRIMDHAEGRCPSSGNLSLVRRFAKGGSGSSGL